MKETSVQQKTSQGKTGEIGQRTSAGPNGVTLAPPAYGISFLDYDFSGSIQASAPVANSLSYASVQMVNKTKPKKKFPKKKRTTDNPFYTGKHFTFDYKHNPIFDAHIDTLIDGLDTDRVDLKKYNKLKDEGKNTYKKKRIQTWIKRSKRSITERIGELNATQYINKNYPKAKMLYGFQKGTGFDQVYENGDEIIIVEAKGPGAKLGISDRKGAQMSLSWVLRTAEGLSNTKLAKKITDSHTNGKLRRLVISSTAKGNAPKYAQELTN